MALYLKKTVTIPSSAAVSDAILGNDLRNANSMTITIPPAWTAADLGFEVSDDDGTTWVPVRDHLWDRIRVQNIDTAEAGVVQAPAEAWGITKHERFRLASLNVSTGANENQGAARSIALKFYD